MWQRFTERSRRAVFFAQEEARRLGTNDVSTEHLLLGLVREEDSLAAQVLDRLGVSLETVRLSVNSLVVQSNEKPTADMQLTPFAKRAIDLSYEEAISHRDDLIETAHLLLGLMREEEGIAYKALAAAGVDTESARLALSEILLSTRRSQTL